MDGLPRFHDTDSAPLLISGSDLKNITRKLKKKISRVPFWEDGNLSVSYFRA
jgi:hypothetical protein